MGVVIVFHAVLIGVESHMSLQNLNAGTDVFDIMPLQTMSNMLLAIYFLELGLRFTAGGWGALFTKPVLFDVVLISLGTVSTVSLAYSQSQQNLLQPVLILRVLRLLRLIRALRFIGSFRTLWRLVSGMMHSVGTILTMTFLLAITIYIAACLSLEIISKDPLLRSNDETKGILEYHFYSLDSVVLMFLQFVTMDSIASIYLPLIKQRGYLCIFFIILIAVISVLMMNLVTAVLIDTVLSNGRADMEMERHKLRILRPEILNAFRQIDTDGDAVLIKQEVSQCMDYLPTDLKNALKTQKTSSFFEILDADGSGTVTEDEFVDGIFQLLYAECSFEMLYALRLLREMKESQNFALECIKSTQSELQGIKEWSMQSVFSAVLADGFPRDNERSNCPDRSQLIEDFSSTES